MIVFEIQSWQSAESFSVCFSEENVTDSMSVGWLTGSTCGSWCELVKAQIRMEGLRVRIPVLEVIFSLHPSTSR